MCFNVFFGNLFTPLSSLSCLQFCNYYWENWHCSPYNVWYWKCHAPGLKWPTMHCNLVLPAFSPNTAVGFLVSGALDCTVSPWGLPAVLGDEWLNSSLNGHWLSEWLAPWTDQTSLRVCSPEAWVFGYISQSRRKSEYGIQVIEL